MRRSTSKEMQWTRDLVNFDLSTAGPVQAHLVVADAQSPNLNANLLLVRSFLQVNMKGLNIQTPITGPLNMVTLGAVRTDPNVPALTITPLQSEDADRSWLYRQDYRLPGTDEETFVNGPIDMNGEPYHLDWQYRGGKGTNVRRDVEIRLVAEARLFAGRLIMTVDMLHLWQTDG